MESEKLFTQRSERRMLFPYTYTAKMVQFPYKHYWDKVWIFKYYCIAVVVGIPIFYKLQKLSYSPNNVKKWEELRRQEFSGEAHH